MSASTKTARAPRSSSATTVTPPRKAKRAARPFPGLRYYAEDQEVFFAGRDDDVQACADKLRQARVLILHGRTGCGKSSFLRAGIKPYLSRAGSAISFTDAPEAFTVIRSTWDPMTAFMSELLRIADAFAQWDTDAAENKEDRRKREAFGELRSTHTKERVQTLFPKDNAFRARLKNDADAAVEALAQLARAMKTPPIIVIDQAEEVFTQKAEGGSFDEQEARRELYFRFLHAVASRDTRTRIVVSLRTEYKGLFDDQIASHDEVDNKDQQSRKLVGFHLKELDERGLIAAILRPTLREGDKEWQDLKRRLHLPERFKAPGDQPGALRISRAAAQQLARDLLSERVPVGGILPTLQTACIRLWDQSANALAQRGERYSIGPTDLRRLGPIDSQVEEYLHETVQAVCARVGWKQDIAGVSATWLRALRDKLVHVEADGRAVALRVPREAFEAFVAKHGGSSFAQFSNQALKLLCDPDAGILKEDAGKIMLCHDSLALALHKWSLSMPSESGMMMMRMGMATIRSLRDLRETDLFLNEEAPHHTKIIVPIDYNWDRLLPHFAQFRNLSSRLGIEIAASDELMASKPPQGRAAKSWNWPQLKRRAVETERDWELENADPRTGKRHRTDKDNQRLLIAADFKMFPGEPVAAKSATGRSAGKAGAVDDPVDYAWRWSDLLVSNLFVGSALIGPDDTFAREFSEIMRRDDGAKAGARTLVASAPRTEDVVNDQLKQVVVAALRSVVDSGGTVRCTNTAGFNLLVTAAELCGQKALADDIRALATSGRLQTLDDAPYATRDPLIFGFLLAKDGEADGEEKRFIVGQAATRAMARQCGFHTYFGARELAMIAAHEMKTRQRTDYDLNERRAAAVAAGDKVKIEEVARDRKAETVRRKSMPKDLAKEVQNIVSHTVWNIGLPAGTWQQGLNRAFALRLASIGYFTSEYVRTNMDDFVNYVSESVNMNFSDDVGEDSMSGQRQIRSSIREAVGECYLFLRFDEYGPEVFDLDSRFAYWSEHGALQTRSVAGEVYQELVHLRQMTLAHYQVCAESISWLRYGEAYNPSDDNVRMAFRLKELAWNNFNIYNFYDAERYMARAADLLRVCVEEDFKRGKAASQGPRPAADPK